MRVLLFIDENDKYYHFNKGTGNYDLEMFETDLLITFGRKEIIEMVKSMRVYEIIELSDIVKLVRFQ